MHKAPFLYKGTLKTLFSLTQQNKATTIMAASSNHLIIYNRVRLSQRLSPDRYSLE